VKLRNVQYDNNPQTLRTVRRHSQQYVKT